MDIRETFAHSLIQDPNSRILELGPLNRPIVRKDNYPNSRYCDIRSTEEVKALYSGNEYLKSTGIGVDISTIVEIDDVIQGTYSDFYANEEKFDVVIASHVLEHMDDLIFSLQDVAGILKPDGIFCIVYPDKRYCFDHFRQSATFREAYQVYCTGIHNNAPMVLDFFLSSVTENNPYRFWGNENLLSLLPVKDVQKAMELYKVALGGQRVPDVHYWPFTDWDFLLFLWDCTRMGLFPYRCVDFLPTKENDQQFCLALCKDHMVLESPTEALDVLREQLARTLPHFYSSQEIRLERLARSQREDIDALQQCRLDEEKLKRQCETLQEQINQQNALLADRNAYIDQRDSQFAILETRIHELLLQVEYVEAEKLHLCQENTMQASKLQSCLEELIERANRITQLETIENSTIWQMTVPLRRALDLFKNKKRGNE